MRTHPLRGAVFETWVVSEALKPRRHAGLPSDHCFYRDAKALEVDRVLGRWLGIHPAPGLGGRNEPIEGGRC